jgi:hypothetical protein
MLTNFLIHKERGIKHAILLSDEIFHKWNSFEYNMARMLKARR